MTRISLPSEPSLRARALRPLFAAFRELRLGQARLLEAAGIDRGAVEDPDSRIPHRSVMKLWQLALEQSGDAKLGFHAALAAPLKSFELHAYALLASRNTRDAFRRACRYQRLIHESTALSFEEGPSVGVLTHALGDGRAVPRQPAEFLATLWCRFGRLIAGERWSARRVCFDHPAPVDTQELESFFACSIEFDSGKTALYVPNEVLDAPNMGADPTMVALLDQHAALLLDRAPVLTTVASRVRAWAAAQLASGEPTTAQAAQALGLSQRSLHRRLSEEGTSYRSVVDQLRREQSLRFLRDSTLSLAEIGFLLGFSELSAFHRAFKRWTGVTPTDYRKAGGVVRR